MQPGCSARYLPPCCPSTSAPAVSLLQPAPPAARCPRSRHVGGCYRSSNPASTTSARLRLMSVEASRLQLHHLRPNVRLLSTTTHQAAPARAATAPAAVFTVAEEAPDTLPHHPIRSPAPLAAAARRPYRSRRRLHHAGQQQATPALSCRGNAGDCDVGRQLTAAAAAGPAPPSASSSADAEGCRRTRQDASPATTPVPKTTTTTSAAAAAGGVATAAAAPKAHAAVDASTPRTWTAMQDPVVESGGEVWGSSPAGRPPHLGPTPPPPPQQQQQQQHAQQQQQQQQQHAQQQQQQQHAQQQRQQHALRQRPHDPHLEQHTEQSSAALPGTSLGRRSLLVTAAAAAVAAPVLPVSRSSALPAAAAPTQGLSAAGLESPPTTTPGRTSAQCRQAHAPFLLRPDYAGPGPLRVARLPRREHTCARCFPACVNGACRLRVDVVYPRGGSELGLGPPYPLAVLSAGFLLAGGEYTSYAERLASWGYTVLLYDRNETLAAPLDDAACVRLLVGLLDWAEGDPLMRRLADPRVRG
ncbi:hypothetical protein Agub_g14838, partial [Astrephomene gubernaculifera]